MLRSWFIYGGFVVPLLWSGSIAGAQSRSKGPTECEPYRLRLPVNEVVLTFNAQDANGLPINDLKLGEIRLWDNGVAPSRIVAFDELANRQIRAGILLDTSESMQRQLPANRAIAMKYVERLFRQESDEAFISEFAYSSDLIQSWTRDASLLLKGVQSTREKGSRPGGTAIFNAIFRACSSSFANVDPTATGNFILLFSDGEDNAGLTSGDEAARACQRSNTQVFAFIPASVEVQLSTGPKALRELVSKTGGQVFLAEDSEDAIWKDLKAIESGMRNQYRLVYNPTNFKHDGVFHEIMLQPPDRVSSVEVRSGYFAPRQ